MPVPIDYRYLECEQYKDASRINARIQLHLLYSTNPYGWFKWIFDQLQLSPHASVLEIGAGPGMLWSENINRLPVQGKIIISDYSPGMLHEARLKLASGPVSLKYAACNAMSLPFLAQTFDAVVANHMLYHVPNIPTALSQIQRILKPGGKFIAATNGADHLVEISDIMESFSKIKHKNYSPTLNVEAFTLENGMQQLTPWFDSVEIRMYDDGLVVIQAEPLLAYILSMIPQAELKTNPSLAEDIFNHISQRLQQQGPIRIRKSVGIFVCEKMV